MVPAKRLLTQPIVLTEPDDHSWNGQVVVTHCMGIRWIASTRLYKTPCSRDSPHPDDVGVSEPNGDLSRSDVPDIDVPPDTYRPIAWGSVPQQIMGGVWCCNVTIIPVQFVNHETNDAP